jgi:hypothetical protein
LSSIAKARSSPAFILLLAQHSVAALGGSDLYRWRCAIIAIEWLAPAAWLGV